MLQDPDPRPLWSSVGTLSGLEPLLASRWAADTTRCHFYILSYHLWCVLVIIFLEISPLVGCWSLVFIRNINYKLLNMPFWLHNGCEEWESWASYCKTASGVAIFWGNSFLGWWTPQRNSAPFTWSSTSSKGSLLPLLWWQRRNDSYNTEKMNN